MKAIKKNITACLLLVTLIVSSSCNKLIDVAQPINSLDQDKVFSDEATAMAALNGLYIQLMSSGLTFSNSQITLTAGFSADELTFTAANAINSEFINNAISPANTSVTSLWTSAYLRIYQCNAIIENTRTSKALSADLKNRLIGETEFMRAYIYFYMVQMFGDVPLVLSTDYTATASISRTPSYNVYQQIIADLKDAMTILTSDVSVGKTRPTKWTAEALLSRVYLYQKKWPDALQAANDVINSGKFQLIPDLTKVFVSGSDEAILQLAPVDGNAYTWEGFYFIPKGAAAPAYPLQDNLINSFETGDQRKLNWIGTKTVSSKTYNYSYKYKVGSGTGSATEYYMLLRFAEMYLIRAEAFANSDDLQNALKDLDIIRSRAGLISFSNDGVSRTQSDVLLLIENERRHELFCEWGHRWFDLNRTSRTQPVLSGLKPGIKATAVLFPIPSSQIQRNGTLVQNSGY